MNNPIVDSELINLDNLAQWMDQQGLPQGSFQNQRLLTGGTQNILLYFERGGEGFVLRRPPKYLRSSSNEAMLREATVLKALKDSNVPNPGYVAHCEDDSVIGANFFLMRPVDGFNPSSGLPSPHKDDPTLRQRMTESHVEALSTLSKIDYQQVGLDNFGKPEGYLERQAGRWMKQLKSYEKYDGYSVSNFNHLDLVMDWLSTNIPSDYKPGIIHGDCHIANTMFCNDSGELAALVDWELSTIGDPLADLGYLLCTWPDKDEHVLIQPGIQDWSGFLTIPEMLAHYKNHSNRNVDSALWFSIVGCFKLAVILESTYARSVAGRADKGIGEIFYDISRKLMNRAEQWIKQGLPQ